MNWIIGHSPYVKPHLNEVAPSGKSLPVKLCFEDVAEHVTEMCGHNLHRYSHFMQLKRITLGVLKSHMSAKPMYVPRISRLTTISRPCIKATLSCDLKVLEINQGSVRNAGYSSISCGSPASSRWKVLYSFHTNSCRAEHKVWTSANLDKCDTRNVSA